MKKILFRASALLIGLGFILASLELFLRINPKFGYNYSFFRFKVDNPTLNNASNSYVRPSALLGYELIPNINLNAGFCTNSYGLVGPERSIKKDKGIFRILILGDSVAEQGWSGRLLEDYLNNTPALRPRYKEFEIWNAGVRGYDIFRYALYLKYKGLKYNPDTVIVFLFMNDFELYMTIMYKNKKGGDEYYFSIREIRKRGLVVSHFLMRHSYLYRFVVLNLDSFLSRNTKVQGLQRQDEDGRYYLGMIKETCEKNKIPLLVVIFPYLKPFNEYKDWQKTEYLSICRVVKELKVDYINLFSLYDRLLKEHFPIRDIQNDEIHPSKEAQRLIARQIYDYLMDRHFFKVHS